MRQLLNPVKKGTGETRGVEIMFLPVLKLVEIFSVACIFKKTSEGKRTENKQKAQTPQSHTIKHYAWNASGE